VAALQPVYPLCTQVPGPGRAVAAYSEGGLSCQVITAAVYGDVSVVTSPSILAPLAVVDEGEPTLD
jgi:hypothetical protein